MVSKDFPIERFRRATARRLRAKATETEILLWKRLRSIETEFQVISTHLTGGQHEIRVFASSSPGPGFHPVPSGLEDVYFLHLARHSKN